MIREKMSEKLARCHVVIVHLQTRRHEREGRKEKEEKGKVLGFALSGERGGVFLWLSFIFQVWSRAGKAKRYGKRSRE